MKTTSTEIIIDPATVASTEIADTKVLVSELEIIIRQLDSVQTRATRLEPKSVDPTFRRRFNRIKYVCQDEIRECNSLISITTGS